MKSQANVQIANRLVGFFSKPRRALVAAGVFHLFVAVVVFGVGRFGIFKQQFDQDGIGHFARDSYSYRTQADHSSETLLHDGIIAWLKAPEQLHVKLYSVCFALFRPLVGANILAAEPLNLLHYLTMLTLVFNLTKRLAGQQAALLASAIVALWPSLLLHTTQLLRDPLFIVAMLALVLILTDVLLRVYTWKRSLTVAIAGVLVSLVLWMTRMETWLVIHAVMVLGLVLLVIRIVRCGKLLPWNLSVIALLLLFAFFVPVLLTIQTSAQPQPPLNDYSVNDYPANADSSIWQRIASRRHAFIVRSRLGQSRSIIDDDVEFSSAADVITYVPRAVEIGYLAPFPDMWFARGYNVGWLGRLVAGVETSLTYLIELLACVFVWQNRRCLQVWLLVLTTATGVAALGMVVVNLGTLYRMRYAFWILATILGSAELVRRKFELRAIKRPTQSLHPSR